MFIRLQELEEARDPPGGTSFLSSSYLDNPVGGLAMRLLFANARAVALALQLQSTQMYMYICMCMYIYIYIYTYIHT